MAQKKSKSKKKKGVARPERQLPRVSINVQSDTKRSMFGIIFFILAVFFILSAYSIAGPVGSAVFHGLSAFLGAGYVFIPLLLFLLGLSLIRHIDFEKHELAATKTIGAVLFFLSGLGLSSTFFPNIGGGIGAGGYLGDIVSWPFVRFFDVYVGAIFESALLLISLLLIFDTPLSFEHRPLSWLKEIFIREKENVDTSDDITVVTPIDENEGNDSEEDYNEDAEGEDDDTEEKTPAPRMKKSAPQEDGDGITLSPAYPLTNHTYTPPPLSLLSSDKGKPDVGDIKANANIIKRTLQNFGITVEMDEISVGPTVTRYALKPAEGVKLSRIVGLQNDLGLALAAHPVRIEAPIPGKSLVGIEVPNSARSTIGLAKLLSDPQFTQSDKPLLFALGRGISGQSFFSNLAKLPHGLIAGATGSGKSVTIHAILASLLYRNGPERMRFIMIDPKRVELTMYNSIPHLLTPVITDPKKAILALKWAAKEMDRRYDVLESESVRDIMSYHENIVGPAYEAAKDKGDTDEESAQLPEAMPYIVVIIDELADIMSAYPRELEASIVRLAQMSRAVGIHLILSTQRPSVNVITGLIKANVPGRIALQVSSQTDSRTILDTGGAEKLLGAGDMLYLSSDMAQPQRIQSAFVTENEIKKIVNYLKKEYAGEDTDDITLGGDDDGPASLSDIMSGAFATGDEDDDDLYEEARQTVVEAGKASTSFLQRKLKVGYARAARLMDMLEERGVVGPADGAKPREVLDGGGNMEGYGEMEEE